MCVLLCLALVYVTVGDVEERAIAAIEVKGGCHVSFTQTHLVKQAATYDGAICRMTGVLFKGSIGITKRHLNYKNKQCVFVVVDIFAYKEKLLKQLDTNANIKPAHNPPKAPSPPTKRQK